ncbi:hypothetical protein L6R53_04535 [Myxococcota bacterium]|nr:hypothetical protein [Myxococcota bacterium]
MWLSLAIALPALAADPLLLPGAPLQAGQPGTVELWAPDLPSDARLKAHAAGARVGAVERLDDGRLRVPVEPGQAGPLALALQVRGPEGKEESTFEVPVVAAFEGGLRATPAQARVVLGRDKLLELAIEPARASAQPPAERRLVVHGSVGRMDAPRSTGSGWTVRWTPPPTLAEPTFAVLGFADGAAPAGMPGWAAVPVLVETPLRFDVEPGAQCSLRAGEESAAAIADPEGSLALRIALHPAVARGELQCTVDGRAFTRAVSLPAGQHPWLGWQPLPPRVTAGASIPLQVVVVEDDGSPRLAGTMPTVTASAGVVGPLQLVGHGLAAGTWTAPAQPGSVRLAARLLGQEVEATIEVVAELPRGSAVAEPPILGDGARDARLAVSGLVPHSVLGQGAALRGRVASDAGGATATVRMDAGRRSATVVLAPELPQSGLVPAAVVGWADTPTLPAGHREPVGLVLAVVDTMGLPVPGVTLALSATGGTVAASTRTDSAGLARVALAPVSDGLLVVHATAAGLQGSVPVLVGLADGALADAPGSGPDRTRILRERLRAALPTVLLARHGQAVGQLPLTSRGAILPPADPATASSAAEAAGQALAAQAEAVARTRPPRPAREEAWARFAVAAATVPHSYRLTSDGDEGLPAEVVADQGDLLRGQVAGAPALHLRAVVQPADLPLGFDARLQGRYEGYVVNDEGFTRLDLQGAAGLRVPLPPTGIARPYLLGQFEYSRVPVFTYADFREENPDKATGARLLTAGVPGARLGGGVGLVLGDLLVEVEGTETLAPWPVQTRAEVGAEYALAPLVGLRAGLELGFRSFRFDLDPAEARVTDQQHALSFGLLFLLR